MSLPSNPTTVDCYVRLPAVKSQTGLSESTIYRLIRLRQFPAPRKLGAHAVGWKASAVTTWCESRPDAREHRAA
jgi:predicted DNA-binding transcriptional regulator AlpA